MAEAEATEAADADEWPQIWEASRTWTLDFDASYYFYNGRGHLVFRFNGGYESRENQMPVFTTTADESFKSAAMSVLKKLREDVLGDDAPPEDTPPPWFIISDALSGDVKTTLVRPYEIVSLESMDPVDGWFPVRMIHGSGDRVEMLVSTGTVVQMKEDWRRCREKAAEKVLECVRAFGPKDGDNAIAKRVRDFLMYV